ncbi:MAG: AAA family ATPase [Coriobacteriia bacterium]|nr:AAA family ATPase [Coriobacteriia bacterium]
MGNFASTKSELRDFVLAGTPLVIVSSVERNRVERMLKELVAENRIDVFYYTDAKQVVNLSADSTSDGGKDVSGDPMPFVNETFCRRRHLTFALGDTRRLGDDNLYTRELLGSIYLAAENHNTLVVVAAEPVWPRLARFGLVTHLDFPDTNERYELVRSFADSQKGVKWDDSEIRHVATLLRGLSEAQISNLLRAALVSNQELGSEDLQSIVARKEQLFSATSSIQQVHLKPNTAVAGLESLKSWLAAKKRVFFARDEELADRDLEVPKGILLVGVPGCGKSFSARMVAQSWELPLFRFDIGSVYNKYVGESERRMQEALDYIDNVAPCVLWIDEIEKALSISDSGNDTGRRILGQFLFWLQESEARAFLIATANDISLLPPELFRKGRFSDVFFVDLPDDEERRQAISDYLRSSLHFAPEPGLMDTCVAATRDFSYADIEYAIKDLAEQVAFEQAGVFEPESLLVAFSKTIPISVRNPEMIEQIRSWGSRRARSASKREQHGQL